MFVAEYKKDVMNKNVKLKIKESYPERVLDILNLVSNIAENRKGRVFLVGGMVRDLLLDNPSIDLDIAVERQGIEFAKKLAFTLKKKINIYPKFYTASVKIDNNLSIDIATCRKETYAKPGALPEVEPSDIKNDLFRRDFTINAIALSLNSKSFGNILDFCNGIEDLKNGRIRILHNDSFKDDPIRILRAIRFIGRLNFRLDSHTEKLMIDAIKQDNFKNVSKDRIRKELILFFKEENFLKQVDVFDKYLGLNFIYKSIRKESVDKKLLKNVERYLKQYKQNVNTNKADVPVSNYKWVVRLMVFVRNLQLNEINELCKNFNFSKEVSNKLKNYKKLQSIVLEKAKKFKKAKPGEIYNILNPFDIEAVFVIMSAIKDKEIIAKIWRFVIKDRFIKLDINGKDLKELGISPGPVFNTVLNKVLCAKIDGEIYSKKDELNFVKKFI